MQKILDKLILEGQILYDLSSLLGANNADTTIIANSSVDFNKPS